MTITTCDVCDERIAIPGRKYRVELQTTSDGDGFDLCFECALKLCGNTSIDLNVLTRGIAVALRYALKLAVGDFLVMR